MAATKSEVNTLKRNLQAAHNEHALGIMQAMHYVDLGIADSEVKKKVMLTLWQCAKDRMVLLGIDWSQIIAAAKDIDRVEETLRQLALLPD